jgi:serine/threonine protein kinase
VPDQKDQQVLEITKEIRVAVAQSVEAAADLLALDSDEFAGLRTDSLSSDLVDAVVAPTARESEAPAEIDVPAGVGKEGVKSAPIGGPIISSVADKGCAESLSSAASALPSASEPCESAAAGVAEASTEDVPSVGPTSSMTENAQANIGPGESAQPPLNNVFVAEPGTVVVAATEALPAFVPAPVLTGPAEQAAAAPRPVLLAPTEALPAFVISPLIQVAQTLPEPSSHPNLSAAPSLQKAQELIGRKVGGRYVLEEFLGSGGMSIVYRGFDKRANRTVAVKLMHQQSEVTSRVLERFQQEGKALSQLDHKNIVKVYEYGMHDSYLPFMVMEYVKGATLSSLLAAQYKLSSQEAVDIVVQVCAALEHAHALRVVHRDLKPSNVMIQTDEQGQKHIKLVDFGIAKIAAETKMQLTNTGDIFGSPLYMSPEQCNGWPVDKRTDLYSLGCVLYECLTGSPPFVGESPMATMLMHQHEAPPSLKEGTLGYTFPERLEQIVARLLQKDRDSRYQSAGDVSADLELLRISGLTSDQPPPLARPADANLDILRSLRGHCADRFGITKEVADAWRVTKAPGALPTSRSILKTCAIGATICLVLAMAAGALHAWLRFLSTGVESENSETVSQLLSRMQTEKERHASDIGSNLTRFTVEPPKAHDVDERSHSTPVAVNTGVGARTPVSTFDRSHGLVLDVSDYYPGNLAAFPKALGNVEEVQFPYGMTLGTREFRMLKNSPVRSVNMSGCLIGVGLREIQNNSGLVALDLSDTNISSTDIEDLNPRIRELVLNECLVDDNMVAKLLPLKNLRRLSLAKTIITDKSMPNLVKMNLERLDIRETRISPEKVKEFLHQKPDCVVILH